MYQKKSNLHNLILMCLDCCSIIVSLILANYIRNGSMFMSDNARMNFGLLLAVSLITFLLLSLFNQLYRDIHTRGFLDESLEIIGANIVIFTGTAFALYFAGILDAYARWMFIYFFLLDCIGMFLLHILWKQYIPRLYKALGQTRRLLIVSESNLAKEILDSLEKKREFHYDIIGVVLLDGDIIDYGYNIPICTSYEKLVDFCQTASLDEILVAVKTNDIEIVEKLNDISDMGITIHYYVPMLKLHGAKQKQLSKIGEYYAITYAERIIPFGQMLVKRVMDICGSIIGCLVLVILSFIITPMIKLESKGPVFFCQKRVGRNGRTFKMFKFRTMYLDAEERKKELLGQNEMNGLMFKMENDPRVTRVGRFLRKTSLDEFPQFLNILKGDMSLVGTRPPTLDEFERYSPYHKKRLSFRPGLTGLWQVSGRSDVNDFEEIVRMDVEYIENWSVKLDIKILLKTFFAVFGQKGAR